MHIEVSVALNFVISYLYNKLPRRRVNIFGEELEKCLTEKFAGHWYPEKPYRGSAYRCIKTGSPIDPVFEKASRESGVAKQDILENLPQDLAVWVDPGEVSYRIGEKGAVKILYNENSGGLQFDTHDDRTADREVIMRVEIVFICFIIIGQINKKNNNNNKAQTICIDFVKDLFRTIICLPVCCIIEFVSSW